MKSTRTTLCLIRHGETPWNRAGLWQGHADPDLTEEGLAQALRLAAELANEHAVRPWTRLYASDLARARNTAVPVAERRCGRMSGATSSMRGVAMASTSVLVAMAAV